MVSSRTSQNVTIEETPVLLQVGAETTSGKGVTVQLPLKFLFLLEQESVSEWDGGEWRKSDSEEVGERRIMLQMLCLKVQVTFPWASCKCLHIVSLSTVK